jgi:ribosomal protein S18 acetylase RimI-like enzyme
MSPRYGEEELPDRQRSIDGRQVRPVTPGDTPGLIALWRETWTKTYGPSLGFSALNEMLQPLEEGATSMLPGSGERGYCLTFGTRIIGSAIVNERGKTAYLWGMYVLPEYQGDGAGSQLLFHAAHEITISKRVEARVLHSSPLESVREVMLGPIFEGGS